MVTSWGNTTLENITSVITKGTTPTSIGKSFTLTGINFIKIECIDKSGQFDKSMFEHIDVETNNILKRSQLNDGDILFSIAGALGRIAIVDERVLPANTNQALAIIRLKKASDAPNRRYVYYQLQSEKTKRIIEEINVSGAQANLSLDNISNLIIPIPEDVKEQERIAEALSDVDSMISSLEKLIAKKKAVKQGAMQELLTGKKRLPGFTGEWIEKRIENIAEVGRGRVISHIEISKNIGGKYPVYSSQTTNNGIMGYLRTYDFDGDYITWTTDGINAGTVFHRSGRFNCTNVCGTLKCRDVNTEFIARRLGVETPNYVATNLANPKLMNDVMKRIIITLPPTIKEQTAIASILSDMDNEIEALEQKLTKTRQIKQGMMQQLLTGKIRLV